LNEPFGFTITARDRRSRARTGRVTVRGKTFETPVFMPVGTAATVKGMQPSQLNELGVGILLCNTYHLFLRPGSKIVASQGGLHKFMGWDGAILTDSGGFQIYSLSDLTEVDDEGLVIKSHLDGTRHHFNAEKIMAIQHDLGSDIVMAFDQCVPHDAPPTEVLRALERTTAWARRCKLEQERFCSDAALFGIVQGGMDPELRRRSAEELCALDLPGYAVGGLSVGEGKELMHSVLDATIPHLPDVKPHYLMGVGPPDDLVNAVAAGVDMFDCVVATRNARNGTLFTRQGAIKMRNSAYRDDPAPLDPECPCPTCQTFSRAYLRHLFNAREMLGPILATIHNVCYFRDLMAAMRTAIREGRFEELRREVLAVYE